jgi:alpha-D-xyloside xylohydrolase
MYYNRNSEPIRDAVKSRKVYLPKGNAWYDFWTNQMYEGGQEIQADAPLETMPLFVKSGAIIPMSPVMQYTDQIPDAPYEIRIYTGADGTFELYEDDGDNYNYEKGQFSIVKLSWNDQRKELIVSQREGAFASLVKERKFNIVFIRPNMKITREVLYTSQKMILSIE